MGVESAFVTRRLIFVHQPSDRQCIDDRHSGVVRRRGCLLVACFYRTHNSLDVSAQL